MSSYEIRINEIHRSNFAIGDNASAVGSQDGDAAEAMVAALDELLSLIATYEPGATREVRDLARAARYEITTEKPEKETFRRLADAAGRMMAKLGSGIAEAGALAEAVTKISDMVRHL